MSTPQSRSRSTSRTRNLPSRPTTPLRPSSRASLRASLQQASTALLQPSGLNNSTRQGGGTGATGSDSLSSSTTLGSPLDYLEPQFAELSDAMADFEANMLHLQIMTESLSRFQESFAAFLYGLGMNAFCVDWMEMPVAESWRMMEARNRREGIMGGSGGHASGAVGEQVGDATFL
jgi:DASH complex subunit DAM1